MYNRSIAADDSCAREREMFVISFIFNFYDANITFFVFSQKMIFLLKNCLNVVDLTVPWCAL